MVKQTNALAGKIGNACHCQRPGAACSRVIRNSDSDISKMSNSSFFKFLKNSSGGVVTWMFRFTLSDLTLPSINGSKRGFLVTPNFNSSMVALDSESFNCHTTRRKGRSTARLDRELRCQGDIYHEGHEEHEGRSFNNSSPSCPSCSSW